MSVHKLTAGAGYDYLTRQVAALDSTDKGRVGLASYYTERGEAPGAWIGSGMDGIDGLAAGDPVTAEQMRALFGSGLHPLAELHLQEAASGRDLRTAGDLAAVLDWRLPEPAINDPGPLPWLPGIPPTLQDHPEWGRYLAERAQLVAGLADQVRDCASQNGGQPVWARPGSHPTAALIGEIAVWRAAVGVDPQDRRPTGAGQLQMASALCQHHLDRSVANCNDSLDGPAARAHQSAARYRRHNHHQHVPEPPADRPAPPRSGW
jgi:hypothetical protein